MPGLPPGFVLDNAPSPAPQGGPVFGAQPIPEKPQRPSAPPNDFTVNTDNRDAVQSLRKEFAGLPTVQAYQTVLRSYSGALNSTDNGSGDNTLIVAYAKMLDPDSVVREGEAASVAGADSTIGRMVAKLQKEFGVDGGGLLSPTIRSNIRREMRNLVQQYSSGYAQTRSQYEGYAKNYGYDPTLIIGPDPAEAYKGTIDSYWQKNPDTPAVTGGIEAPLTREESVALYGREVFDGSGAPLGRDGGIGYDANGNELGMFGTQTDTSPNMHDKAVKAQIAHDNRVLGPVSISDLAMMPNAFGLGDETAGVGNAIGKLLKGDTNFGENYRVGRDAEAIRLEDARKRYGWAGTAAEVIGGLALPAGAVGKVASVGSAAKAGAMVGGIAGFGQGRGTEASVGNALLGAGTGALVGGLAQKAGNALAGRTPPGGGGGLTQRVEKIDAAGQAEGVTVNRAMADPALQNRVTGVDATLLGGRRIQREMTQIEGQIEGRVGALGRGGRVMDEVSGGQTVERAGKRFIEQSGAQAGRKYTRAEQLAGDARVEPTQSLQAVDGMIARLSETPGTNASEINFLQTIKGDLAGNGQGLTVGALRRLRTQLRQRISKGELTFGEDEARVLGIMDAAAQDITVGLQAQGKGAAAKAFETADTAYRARMEYIKGTLQGIMGRRSANVPAEKMWQRFESMASNRGDSVGLRKFYATLTPEERADVAATFAQDLGRNNKGVFTPTQFLRQTENLSDDALRTVFGTDGAQSVQNLRVLAREVERVTGAMNSRTSKSGVAGASNLRELVISTLLGAGATGGAGLLGGSAPAMATMATGAAVAGVGSARSILSARALTSTNLTKWLRQTPATTSPAAIDKHFAKLADIAKLEPALAGEIDAIRRAIMSAANDNVGQAGAAVASPNQGPDQRPQR